VRKDARLVDMIGQHYHPRANYRGDRWVSASELHLIDARPLQASRVSLMPPGADPVVFVLHQSELSAQQGDPSFNNVQGTPTSGTTVLRLVPENPKPIDSLDLTVLHSFFD